MENSQNSSHILNVTDYPECFFTSSCKKENMNNETVNNNISNNNVSNNNECASNLNNIFGNGLIKNLIPLLLGKNKSLSSLFSNNGINFANILNSKQDFSGIINNNNLDISKILSLFSNNKNKSKKEKEGENDCKNIIDISEYTEVT